MNKEILTITIDDMKQKLYFLFHQCGYEFKAYKLTSRLLPKINDDFTIICKDKNQNLKNLIYD